MTSTRKQPSISRRRFAAGLALSPLASATPRHTAARQATPAANEDVFRYAFGDAEVCLFNTDHVWLETSVGAANASEEECRAVTAESGPFFGDIIVTLVDTGDHLMLLDAGSFGGLADTLEREGYNPLDIDVITFSNLHYDHIFGAFTFGTPAAGEIAFPNARHVVSRAEHDYWMGEDDRPVSEYAQPWIDMFRYDAQQFIAAVGEQLELVEWDEEFLPGTRMLPAIGHTGGHAAVEIVSGDETLLHVGDLIVNPVLHLEHPDWYIAASVWPEDDLASRRRLMDRAADEHLLVQTVHFPFPGAGYVERDGDAWRWLPLA